LIHRQTQLELAQGDQESRVSRREPHAHDVSDDVGPRQHSHCDSCRRTLEFTGQAPKGYDFKTGVIGVFRSPLCSASMLMAARTSLPTPKTTSKCDALASPERELPGDHLA